MLPTLLSAYIRYVSSTYILGSHSVTNIIYHKNKSGPRMVAWRRLQVNTRLSDKDPLTERCVYGSPNTTETILMNYQIYHKSQVSWSTLSKAFFRSRKITALIFPRSLFYNLRNSFFGPSLDKTDHVTQIGRCLSDDIRRPIWYPSSDDNFRAIRRRPLPIPSSSRPPS